MSESYPKTEMDLKMNSVYSKIDHNHGEVMTELKQHRKVHAEMLEQVKKTNGRTTKNEQDILTVNTKINTAIWVFGITLPIIISLIVFIFWNQLQTVQDSVAGKVVEELQSYQFEIVE